MKSNSVRYLTKEGFRNIRVNSLMSLASVTVLMSCLVIIGSAFLLFLNISSMLDGVESQNVVMVFVQDAATQQQTEQLRLDIEAVPNIESCEFVSKDEGYRSILESMGQDAALLDGMDSSFLPDAYKVTMKDLSQFDVTVAQLKALNNIGTVRENSGLAEKLTEIRTSVTYICMGIIALLFVVAVFIIANTVRITMYSRRLEISIMKAVGATNRFIRWPFLIEGMTLGFISAVVAEVVLYVLYTIASNSLASVLVMFDSDIVPFSSGAGVIFVAFVVIGLFTGSFGSLVSMGKYLKEQGSVITLE